MTQWAFACTASTIVSGSVAERIQIKTYIAFSIFITIIIYPLCAHWVWHPEGWLKKLDFVDFAGCGPIHLLGGISGLSSTIALGPREGRFDPLREKEFILPSNISHVVMGFYF